MQSTFPGLSLAGLSSPLKSFVSLALITAEPGAHVLRSGPRGHAGGSAGPSGAPPRPGTQGKLLRPSCRLQVVSSDNTNEFLLRHLLPLFLPKLELLSLLILLAASPVRPSVLLLLLLLAGPSCLLCVLRWCHRTAWDRGESSLSHPLIGKDVGRKSFCKWPACSYRPCQVPVPGSRLSCGHGSDTLHVPSSGLGTSFLVYLSAQIGCSTAEAAHQWVSVLEAAASQRATVGVPHSSKPPVAVVALYQELQDRLLQYSTEQYRAVQCLVHCSAIVGCGTERQSCAPA